MRALAHAAVIAALLLSATANAAVETYFAETRRVTHRGQAYNAFTWDAEVIWYATFFDDKFRTAFAKKHAKINHMGPIETAQWIEDQEYVQQRQWEVFISFYTKKDYKKFSLDSDSFWQIFLTTGKGEVVWPTAIEQVPITPYEKIMYRHINRWSKGYKVIFPKVNLGETYELTLQSIVGQSHLVWINPK